MCHFDGERCRSQPVFGGVQPGPVSSIFAPTSLRLTGDFGQPSKFSQGRASRPAIVSRLGGCCASKRLRV